MLRVRDKNVSATKMISMYQKDLQIASDGSTLSD